MVFCIRGRDLPEFKDGCVRAAGKKVQALVPLLLLFSLTII
jgi:hypothetical protein